MMAITRIIIPSTIHTPTPNLKPPSMRTDACLEGVPL